MFLLLFLANIATQILSLIKTLFTSHVPKKTKNTSAHHILFILAHPDDEAMFCIPTIQGLLSEANTRVHFVYFTIGGFDGMGETRFRELDKALRCVLGKSTLHRITEVEQIRSGQRCIALDREEWFQDTMDAKVRWDASMGVKVIERAVQEWQITEIMTFDERGISGHPNHVSCFEFVRKWMQTSQHSVPCYKLETVGLLRKYMSFWDVTGTILSRPTKDDNHQLYLAKSVPQVVHAMECHYSQWVWFRKLFVLFSRYSFVNTWERIR